MEGLQDDTMGPPITSIYRELQLVKSSTDGDILWLMDYAASPFPDFDCYLRNTGDLNEDDTQLILKQYIRKFVRYEIPPDIYSIKDTPEIVYTKADRAGTVQLEYNDINMKKNSFFNVLVNL